MEVQWMNHTGFVVSDIERSLAFYRDLLGLSIERDQVLEGDFISEVVGYPDARLRIVYLGAGDQRHSVELIQYLNRRGMPSRCPSATRWERPTWASSSTIWTRFTPTSARRG